MSSTAASAVVAPGFIDVHTHDDAIVLARAGHAAEVSPGRHHGGRRQLRHQPGAARSPMSPPPPLNLLGAASFRYPTMAAYRERRAGAAGRR